MKRILGSINRRGSRDSTNGSLPNGDSPEATVARGVRLFCESGGPNNSGEEVLHLPVIVEAAESSPAAAREASTQIRKFLHRDNYQRAYVQYNAIMLVRILADNPGRSFTRNIDAKFVGTVKELLREGKDMSVRQILWETLDTFETQQAGEENLALLRAMWKKEKPKLRQINYTPPQVPTMHAAVPNPSQPTYAPSRPRRHHGLPPPAELSQRIEEARTSSKLLLQVVQSSPASEVPSNELIKEFVERCQAASRSIQGYIHADNPAPDADTLLTLIETNDQLSTALSRHQRALLQARRVGVAGATVSPSPPVNLPPASDLRGSGGAIVEAPGDQSRSPPNNNPSPFSPPPGPPPRRQAQPPYDPFDDPQDASQQHADAMQAPLQPQSFGLPPPQNGAHYGSYGFSGYEPDGSSALNNNSRRLNSSNNPYSPPLASAEQARSAVQYRF